VRRRRRSPPTLVAGVDLRAVLHEAAAGVDHEDALGGRSVLFVDHHDAGGGTGAAGKVRGQADDALDVCTRLFRCSSASADVQQVGVVALFGWRRPEGLEAVVRMVRGSRPVRRGEGPNGGDHTRSAFTGGGCEGSHQRVAANGAATAPQRGCRVGDPAPSGAEPSPVTSASRRAPDGAACPAVLSGVRGQDPHSGSTGEFQEEIGAIVEVPKTVTSQVGFAWIAACR
jgi:hypothetical protein